MTEMVAALEFQDDGRRPWPVQGDCTYREYLRLPEDGRRYEVLRGTLYRKDSPTCGHQLAITHLICSLSPFIRDRGLGVLLPARFDIRLPRKLADPVMPDLVFFGKGNTPKPGDTYFKGAPDLVLEVLSPESMEVDRRIKFDIYREAGVPEYWLVDPQDRTVEIYRLSEDGKGYVEWALGREGAVVGSVALSGLRLAVSGIFPR